MRKLYLIIAIVFAIGMLIISFANWTTMSIRFFFSFYTFPLTIPFLLIGIFGIIVGSSLTLFFKDINEKENDEDSDQEDEF